MLDGVRILRYPLRAATGGPAGYLREYGLALWHTLRLARRVRREGPVHVVQACNPPDLLFLAALPLMARGAKFVFDHHDLVPELFRVPVRRRRRGAVPGGDAGRADHVRPRRRRDQHQRELPAGRADPRPQAAPTSCRWCAARPDLTRFRPREPDPALRRGKRLPGRLRRRDGPAGRRGLRAAGARRTCATSRAATTCTRSSWGTATRSTTWSRWPSELELDDCVEFPGRVSDEFLQRCLSTADVCLSPDPREPAQRRVHDEQGRRVHGDGPADRLLRPDRGAGVGGRGGRLRRRRRRAGVRRAARRRCSTTRTGAPRWARSAGPGSPTSCPGRRPGATCSEFYERLIGPADASRSGRTRGATVTRRSTGVSDRLAWYAARARAMSPAEVAWRAGNAAAGALARRRTASAAATRDSPGSRPTAGSGPAAGRPVLLDQPRATALAAALPAEAAGGDRRRRRGAASTGSASSARTRSASPAASIDWNLDPRTGHRWPRVPAAGIDHRTHRRRPQVDLGAEPAAAPAVAGPGLDVHRRATRYADAALEQLDSWIEQNPPGPGIAWRGGFEAGRAGDLGGRRGAGPAGRPGHDRCRATGRR